jgi:hypothetical protein
LKKEVIEAGCDPIDFDAMERVEQVEFSASEEPTPRVKTPPPRKLEIKLEDDWAKSKVFTSV